jgi:K+-transporting ATPase ATPase C chain
MKTWIHSLGVLAVFTVLTGVLYPLAVTGLGMGLWPAQARGMPHLLAQKTTDPRWFWPRPSAADYATLPSGASNLAPSNKALRDNVEARRAQLGDVATDIPPELLLASGSGLDPHLSPQAARLQLPRICQARRWTQSRCRELELKMNAAVEAPTFGFLGRVRVNANSLNLILFHEEATR